MRPPEFWNHAHGRISAPLTRMLLGPVSWAYQHISKRLRARIRPVKISVPVICVGNVSMGGTGKTPLAMCLANRLQSAGKKPAFITRGFGGKMRGPVQVDVTRHSFHDVGDEALLLAEIAPTFVGRDKVAAAKLAIANGADCILMDDGFQNPALAKDLSILVIDGPIGHGNGRIFPAGPLRESVPDAYARADVLVIMGTAHPTLPISQLDMPVYYGALSPDAPPPMGPLVAFAGIGRPEKFFDALRGAGADLQQEIAFADHHPYGTKDVEYLLRWKENGVQLITTEKDLLRWPGAHQKDVLVYAVRVQFKHSTDIDHILQGILHPCT